MEFHEYPKALYKGEECRIVPDAVGEADARADGFAMAGEEAPATRTRKPRRDADADAE